MKTIMVVGGSGFIASYTMSKLVDMGHKCVSYSRSPPPQGIKLYDRGMIEFVLGDVNDWGKIIDTIKKYNIDTICYTSHSLAASAQIRPPISVSANVQGPLTVFEAARIFDIKRVVLVSGSAVYGTTFYELNEIVTEDLPLRPTAIYGSCKVFTENLLRNYSNDYGIEGVAVRPSDVTGPGKSTRGLHHMKDIVEGAFFDKFVTMPFEEDAYINMSYVKDVANGIALACTVEPLIHKFREYNITVGVVKPYPKINDFIKTIKVLSPETEIEMLPQPKTYKMWEGYLDITRARNELGYEPQFLTPDKMVRDWINTLKNYKFLRNLDHYSGISFPWK